MDVWFLFSAEASFLLVSFFIIYAIPTSPFILKKWFFHLYNTRCHRVSGGQQQSTLERALVSYRSAWLMVDKTLPPVDELSCWSCQTITSLSGHIICLCCMLTHFANQLSQLSIGAAYKKELITALSAIFKLTPSEIVEGCRLSGVYCICCGVSAHYKVWEDLFWKVAI